MNRNTVADSSFILHPFFYCLETPIRVESTCFEGNLEPLGSDVPGLHPWLKRYNWHFLPSLPGFGWTSPLLDG